MKAKPLPSTEELNRIFDYNPESGLLTTKIKLANRVPANTIVGSLSSAGYLKVSVKGSSFAVHRIAWKLMTEEEPSVVDHINHIKFDNRFCNLRGTSYQINNLNRKGTKGYCILPNKTFRVTLSGKDVGYFKEEALALQAYKDAKYEYFGL